MHIYAQAVHLSTVKLMLTPLLMAHRGRADGFGLALRVRLVGGVCLSEDGKRPRPSETCHSRVNSRLHLVVDVVDVLLGVDEVGASSRPPWVEGLGAGSCRAAAGAGVGEEPRRRRP